MSPAVACLILQQAVIAARAGITCVCFTAVLLMLGVEWAFIKYLPHGWTLSFLSVVFELLQIF